MTEKRREVGRKEGEVKEGGEEGSNQCNYVCCLMTGGMCGLLQCNIHGACIGRKQHIILYCEDYGKMDWCMNE